VTARTAKNTGIRIPADVLREISSQDNWVPAFLSVFAFRGTEEPATRWEAEASVAFWNSRKQMFLDAAEQALGKEASGFYLPDLQTVEIWPGDDDGKRFAVLPDDDLGRYCLEASEKIRALSPGGKRPADPAAYRILSEARRAWRGCVMAAHPAVAAKGLDTQDRIFARSRDRFENACGKFLAEHAIP